MICALSWFNSYVCVSVTSLQKVVRGTDTDINAKIYREMVELSYQLIPRRETKIETTFCLPNAKRHLPGRWVLRKVCATRHGPAGYLATHIHSFEFKFACQSHSIASFSCRSLTDYITSPFIGHETPIHSIPLSQIPVDVTQTACPLRRKHIMPKTVFVPRARRFCCFCVVCGQLCVADDITEKFIPPGHVRFPTVNFRKTLL